MDSGSELESESELSTPSVSANRPRRTTSAKPRPRASKGGRYIVSVDLSRVQGVFGSGDKRGM